METICCDLCHGCEADTLYSGRQLGGETPSECALVQCRQCGLIYLNPRPTADEIGAFYPDNYGCYRPAVEDERLGLMRWIRRRKLTQRRERIEKYSRRKQGRVLDVGCSTGLFLNEMKLAGWETYGVEPSSAAAQYARQRFGLNVCEGTLAQFEAVPQSFDVITYWDVLEHTFSPTVELQSSAELLKPGGLIVINIPNYDSPEREWFEPQWNGFDPPRHLYVFSQANLTMFLKQNGFEVLAWDCFIASYYSFIISLEKWLALRLPRGANVARKLLNIPGVRFFFEPYFTFQQRKKRGSVITVFAQKLAVEESSR